MTNDLVLGAAFILVLLFIPAVSWLFKRFFGDKNISDERTFEAMKRVNDLYKQTEILQGMIGSGHFKNDLRIVIGLMKLSEAYEEIFTVNEIEAHEDKKAAQSRDIIEFEKSLIEKYRHRVQF